MAKACGAVTLAMLVGCGGGGGGSSAKAPPPVVAGPPAVDPAPAPQDPGATSVPAPELPAAPPAPPPPITVGGWSFFSTAQGLTSGDVRDVSADEGGNVYVAGFDALYVKKRGDLAFARVDAAAAGLTPSCHAPQYIRNATPPDPLAPCPVISVGGLAAGNAVVGYKGVGTDDDADARWAIFSGGADVVSFDGTAVARVRRVLDASPPFVVCEHWANPPTNTECLPGDDTWNTGRKKMRQINRIAINRKPGIGVRDALLGGSHGTFSVLVANPNQRGWSAFDRTAAAAKTDPVWADAKFVWEHEHADATTAPNGAFRSGETWALAFDPSSGAAWGANEFQIATMPGYASMSRPATNNWWGDVVVTTLWHPERDPANGGLRDNVQSIAFCDDGTLWAGSLGNGLARRATDGSWSFVSLPAVYGDAVYAVACDPSDRSVWIGLAFGGILRLRNGAFEDPFAGLVGVPDSAALASVRSIQIDRWAKPRIVYFAQLPFKDLHGADRPGGVAAYTGP